MSVFTNPAAGAAEDADRYIRAVLELLGDQDPLSVLRSTPAWCADRLAELSADRIETPEAEGKWSIAQILQHLADSELVWGYRIRKVLAEDRPELTGYDQDLWAERLGYDDARPHDALALFRTLREANLRLLAAASDTELDRVGLHVERGEESVRHMIRLYAGHDLVHRNQIDRVRAKVA